MNHLLETDSVVLESGFRQILDRACLRCETGKITGLLGRNGSGKSCLLRIIFGELNPREASIRLDGRSWLGRARNCQDIRYMPQETFVPKYLTVGQVFRDFKADFDDFVHFFPEFAKLHKARCGRLSGGERRIMELFNILTAKSKFSLLDEPFAKVMPVHIEILKGIIRRERANKGILITDHLYQDIVDISDDLYVLVGGKTQLIRENEDLKRLGYVH